MSWNFLALRRKVSGAHQPLGQGGFGLVELMVSISIMVIVSSIILARQSSFNSAVLLRSQAYEIALQVREVQLNAVSASSNASAGNFRSILGVHFDTDNNSQYKIFRDDGSNGFYDTGEEFGVQGIIDNRFEIREIRAVGDSISGTELSVIFVRPNFDARFFDVNGEVNASSIEIDIARRGITGTSTSVLRTLEITSTGQIAVQ